MYDDNQRTCHKHGGFLPEPRDEGENLFLDSLGSNMFALGMTDKVSEGQWVWESDGSSVNWTSWQTYANGASQPSGGVRENCAMMFRTWQSSEAGHRSEGWNDYPCRHADYKYLPKSLVCQRNPGEFGECA